MKMIFPKEWAFLAKRVKAKNYPLQPELEQNWSER